MLPAMHMAAHQSAGSESSPVPAPAQHVACEHLLLPGLVQEGVVHSVAQHQASSRHLQPALAESSLAQHRESSMALAPLNMVSRHFVGISYANHEPWQSKPLPGMLLQITGRG